MSACYRLSTVTINAKVCVCMCRCVCVFIHVTILLVGCSKMKIKIIHYIVNTIEGTQFTSSGNESSHYSSLSLLP